MRPSPFHASLGEPLLPALGKSTCKRGSVEALNSARTIPYGLEALKLGFVSQQDIWEGKVSGKPRPANPNSRKRDPVKYSLGFRV